MATATVTFIGPFVDAVPLPGFPPGTRRFWRFTSPMFDFTVVTATAQPFSQGGASTSKNWEVIATSRRVVDPGAVQSFEVIVRNNGPNPSNYMMFLSLVGP